MLRHSYSYDESQQARPHVDHRVENLYLFPPALAPYVHSHATTHTEPEDEAAIPFISSLELESRAMLAIEQQFASVNPGMSLLTEEGMLHTPQYGDMQPELLPPWQAHAEAAVPYSAPELMLLASSHVYPYHPPTSTGSSGSSSSFRAAAIAAEMPSPVSSVAQKMTPSDANLQFLRNDYEPLPPQAAEIHPQMYPRFEMKQEDAIVVSRDITHGLRRAPRLSDVRHHLDLAVSLAQGTFLKSEPDDKVRPMEKYTGRPWPITRAWSDESGMQSIGASMDVPLPCLSAADRWAKFLQTHPDREFSMPSQFTCAHCEVNFDDVNEFTAHLAEEKICHDNFCPDQHCVFSALGFRFRWLLRRHICNHHLKTYNNRKSHKNEGAHKRGHAMQQFLEHVYVCQKSNCKRAFYRLDSLQRHERLLHLTERKVKSRRKHKLKLGKCDVDAFD